MPMTPGMSRQRPAMAKAVSVNRMVMMIIQEDSCFEIIYLCGYEAWLRGCCGIFLALGLQTAFTSPTPTNVQPDGMVVRRAEYLNDIRLADENETPPATVVFPKENNKRDSAVGLAPRQGGPTNIPSTDGKFDIGSYLCSQKTEITKYSFYSSGESGKLESLPPVHLNTRFTLLHQISKNIRQQSARKSLRQKSALMARVRLSSPWALPQWKPPNYFEQRSRYAYSVPRPLPLKRPSLSLAKRPPSNPVLTH